MSAADKPDRMLLIPKIKHGTVVDHIAAGEGPAIVDIIRAHPGMSDLVMSIGLNLESRSMGRKDMVKVQESGLPPAVLEQISLVSPGVTIKRITDYVVDRKYVSSPPTRIDGLARCLNPNCISNHEQSVRTRFRAIDDARRKYRCSYCERVFGLDELEFTYP